MRMCHISICDLHGCTIFFNFISQTLRFSKKKNIEHETCLNFSYKFLLKHFSFYEELREIWSKMYIGLHVKYPIFLSDFNETWLFLTDFQKILKYQISWKSIQWELSCSVWMDRQTWWSWQSLCNFANTQVYLVTQLHSPDLGKRLSQSKHCSVQNPQ
jgi:hypothetical protein